MQEEHISWKKKWIINYIISYVVISEELDDEDEESCEIELIDNGFNIIRDAPPAYNHNQFIEPKFCYQIIYINDSSYFKNNSIYGSKFKMMYELSLKTSGLSNKLSIESGNILDLTKMFRVNSFNIDIKNRIFMGFIDGKTSHYDSFFLGGTKTLRGFKDGELGVSSDFLSSTIELRVHLNSTINNIYLFFDFCSNLNSSHKIIYDPSNYHALMGHGTASGIGALIGSGRIEYGVKSSSKKTFINFDYGERL